MTVAEYLRLSLEGLHSHLHDDVRELTPEQLSWRPSREANNIAFLLFHLVRIEDSIVHGLLKQAPSIWERDGWHQKLGLDAQSIGVGFTPEQVGALSYPLGDFLDYAQAVWQATSEHVGSLTDADLERDVNLPMVPEVKNVAGLIGGVLLAHGWWHTGEILYIKGLQGWRYRL